jgi:alkylated DNA nucleotide flippase Atl1
VPTATQAPTAGEVATLHEAAQEAGGERVGERCMAREPAGSKLPLQRHVALQRRMAAKAAAGWSRCSGRWDR